MRSRIVLAGAAAVLIATTVTGCTTSVDGQATPASQTLSPGEVDLAALDPGTYQTTPSPAFGMATGAQIVEYEGQRMAEFVYTPSEIDPEFTDVKNPTSIIRSRANLTNVVGRDAAFVPANDRLVAGFVTSAGTPQLRLSDPTRGMNLMVVRYTDSATATGAARSMFDAMVRQNRSIPVPLAGLGTTLAARTNLGGSAAVPIAPTLATFTPFKDYVIYAWADAPAGQEKRSEDTVRAVIAREPGLLNGFPATPTKAQNGGKPVEVAVDQDQILLYALPNKDENAVNGSDRAVYGPRGMAHIASSPSTMLSTLTAAKSTHNAVWDTTVYRAATGAGATSIMNDLVNADVQNGATEVDSPRGLPIASCVSRDTDNGAENTCFVTVGRYVGEADDRDPAVVAQKISAQYLILTRADQTAN
ncbi:DUF7373 family lipoprotein [Williamsia sp. MIQD14]|uniref:DUF7373 family lipoprotein n=1 Tax=Williamsia sp. MIQD14 TaxID=3425703 RepID=UPI003DA0A9FB